MFKAISAVILLTFTLSSFAAGNLEGFHKRFTILKNDKGEVTSVKMNMVTKKFSLIPYVRQVKSDIKKEIARMNTKSFNNDLDSLLTTLREGSNKSSDTDEYVSTIERSFTNLKDVEVDKFFSSVETQGVLAKYKNDIQNAFATMSLGTIANTQDPRYFYKRNVTYEVVKKALDYAKKKFDSVPLLNLASFLIVQVHDMILEQRLTHQNMLLFYLENVSEQELGLTVNDADKIFSSIYESRISATSYRESSNAAANWSSYGLNKFYLMLRTANSKLRRSTYMFDETPQRINFGFVSVTQNGERLIKNLIHSKHSFSSDMAVAYNFDKPDQVRRFRSLLNLGQVALGFLPIPSWLKGNVEGFMKSFYVEQKILEGSLIGYFEYTGDVKMADAVKNQMINPYFLY